MSDIVTTELKSDLENIYKTTGDLLNYLELKDFEKESGDIRELIGFIKFRLEDIEGTLQKDIFNCDYLDTKTKVLSES